jgi:hypothetical protein
LPVDSLRQCHNERAKLYLRVWGEFYFFYIFQVIVREEGKVEKGCSRFFVARSLILSNGLITLLINRNDRIFSPNRRETLTLRQVVEMVWEEEGLDFFFC